MITKDLLSAAAGQELATLLRRLAALPSLRIEQHGASVVVRSRIRDLTLATLDVKSGALRADVEPDLLGWLRRDLPQLEANAHGVQVRVNDRDSRHTAEQLIRWRIEAERYGMQFRNASP